MTYRRSHERRTRAKLSNDARALRLLQRKLREAVRSRGLSDQERFAAAEALAALENGQPVADALAVLEELLAIIYLTQVPTMPTPKR